MTAHSGDRAERTGGFTCANCGEEVYVTRGDSIPRCPSCGSESYEASDEDKGEDILR
jgi:Zn finger protein HypA/HybF involved in hydrogenase expression